MKRRFKIMLVILLIIGYWSLWHLNGMDLFYKVIISALWFIGTLIILLSQLDNKQENGE